MSYVVVEFYKNFPFCEGKYNKHLAFKIQMDRKTLALAFFCDSASGQSSKSSCVKNDGQLFGITVDQEKLECTYTH